MTAHEAAESFADCVQRALDSLPERLAERMDNVAIVIEARNPDDPRLYGLYTGIPLTHRDTRYGAALPDMIEIYREPLLADFGDDPQQLEQQIRITVLHEIAHHFGIEEARLGELGWS